MYDVIVVGARCAGSPLAMLLARQGHSVLVVDRATFPSDTESTHAVKKPAVARLAAWGLLDEVLATGCPPLRTMRLDVGPLVLEGVAPDAGPGGEVTIAPRRTLLDAILVAAAAKAGAEVREGFTVDEVVFDGDRVAGIRGRGAGGSAGEERARFVVGADGRHSLVQRAVGAAPYIDRGTLSAFTYSYWADLPTDSIEFWMRPGRFLVSFPTNDGLAAVGMSVPAAQAGQVRKDVEGTFRSTVAMAPSLADRLSGATRQGRFVFASDLPNVVRQSFGPGWALAGDAGYHKDPITAEGITNAFRDAEGLSIALHAVLADGADEAEALGHFQRQRDATNLPIFELTCSMAALGPPAPPISDLLPALPGNQDATDQFFGLIEGTTSIPEFLDPANIGRLVADH